MAFPSAWLDELLHKNDIVSVVSDYVELKPKGRKLWACCPLHGEKTPSFSVSPDKQLFYCFGCHAGGTVIQFVMDMERLTFYEAVQQLANRVGMELPNEINDREMQRQRAYKKRMIEANTEAARYYSRCFLDPETGREAQAYAARRGLNADIVTRFGIGYAPDTWDSLLKLLKGKGYSEKELVDAGLLVHNAERGTVYDAFRGRLIFPILGVNGQVLGFGARVMGDEKPKYINSNDTPAFNKRKNLFALNYAKNAKEDYFILCEGYTDVIALHMAGFQTAVASLGTSFTSEQAALMKKYKPKVIICYDGDAAGQNATQKAIALTTAAGLETKVLQIPDGLDPDEYIRKRGKEQFRALLGNCYGQVDFRCETALAKYDTSSDEQRVSAAKEVSDIIASLYTAIEREIYGAKYAKRLELNTDNYLALIEKKAAKLQKDRANEEKKRIILASEGYGDRVNPDMVKMKKAAYAEEALLGMAQISPEFLTKAEECGRLNPDDFMTGFGCKIYGLIRDCVNEHGRFDLALISEALSPEEIGRVTKMRVGRESLSDNSYEVFLQYADALRGEKEQSKESGEATFDSIQDIINKKKKQKPEG